MPASPPITLDVTFTLTFDPATTSLTELEWDLRRESRRALTAALADALARVEQRLVAELAPCARCGGAMRSRGRILRRLVSLFGPVSVRRARYACVACRAVRQPLDEWMAHERFGVYSRSVCEQALYLAADLSFERAAEVLRHIGGVAMSGRQIERVLRAEGPRMAAALGVDAATTAAASVLGAVAAPLLDGMPPLRAPDAPGALPPLDAFELPTSSVAPTTPLPSDLIALVPGERFRRATPGATLVARLRQLKRAGRWSAYWTERPSAPAPAPSSSAAGVDTSTSAELPPSSRPRGS